MASQDLTTLLLFEEWRDIQDYEGYYQVSNRGNVRSVDREIHRSDGKIKRFKGHLLVPRRHGSDNGPSIGFYVDVNLSKGNIQRSILVHVLVAQHFIPNPLNLPEVNHKNGIKNDNFADNLEWMSHHGNIIHAHKTGLIQNQGERNPSATLTNENVLFIWQRLQNGEKLLPLAEEFGVAFQTISSIKRKKKWKNLLRDL